MSARPDPSVRNAPPGAVDVVLIGTGVAPLVAAKGLLEAGKSVLLLNPDFDYFREQSELPLHPFPGGDAPNGLKRWLRSDHEQALEALRPEFPGAVEFWSSQIQKTGASSGYRDRHAPHVRQRSRLMISPRVSSGKRDPDLEACFIEASDAGMVPQLLEGIQAWSKFPGFSARGGTARVGAEYRGLWMPRGCDFDVARYRNGIQEFVRERAGESSIFCAVSNIELFDEGIRYHSPSGVRTTRVNEGVLAYWTPRLTPWIEQWIGKTGTSRMPRPEGVRLYEEWSLVSKEELDPEIQGVFEGMTVWAECEGVPEAPHRLAVLRPGEVRRMGDTSEDWVGAESFQAVNRLCREFLLWEKFTIRAMRPRMILEWKEARPFRLDAGGRFAAWVVCPADGPLSDVVYSARESVALCTGTGP